MKILFASRYVDPLNPRANQNIVRQARVLQEEFGIDLEILTWPQGNRNGYSDLWGGPVPDEVPTKTPLKVRRGGLSYSVISLPALWDEMAGGNVISENAWTNAVEYGEKLLAALKPDVFHLHHRFGFWWLLESAHRLGIPTVYTNYDWGIACLRSILVNNSGDLCDGVVSPAKCAACIKMGRTKLFGKLNERISETYLGEKILIQLEESSLTGRKFRTLGAVSKSAKLRSATNYSRVIRVMEKLGHCVTPSPFGAKFFQQFGIADENLTVMPWYHDPITVTPAHSLCAEPFTITFIGRVSPDKGVHLILEALEKLNEISPVLLRVAGADESEYCSRLQAKYSQFVGKHRVEWRGWSPIDELLRTTDVTIISSTWMDNTPLTFIEAMAYKVPVIAVAIPTITSMISKHVAYLAENNSIESLSAAIKSAALDQELIRSREIKFPKILTPYEYSERLVSIYERLIANRVH